MHRLQTCQRWVYLPFLPVRYDLLQCALLRHVNIGFTDMWPFLSLCWAEAGLKYMIKVECFMVRLRIDWLVMQGLLCDQVAFPGSTP